jgi:hypothetical protein
MHRLTLSAPGSPLLAQADVARYAESSETGRMVERISEN